MVVSKKKKKNLILLELLSIPISFIEIEKKYTKNTNLAFQFFVLIFCSKYSFFYVIHAIHIYTPLECCMSCTSFHIALNFKGNKKTIFIKMTI